MDAQGYAPLDPALGIVARSGPDLRNGLTNHAPMAVEALCALARPEAVEPWLAGYREGMLPRPAAGARIARDAWRSVLGTPGRFADWSAFFADELEDAPWQDVLARWAERLAPALCASATHGVIRVGHAARALAAADTPARRRELADGLGYWAAEWQTLPARAGTRPALHARDAIRAVPVVPPAERVFTGTIVSSLAALDDFPAFAPVIDLLDVGGDPARILSELTETFARTYLANAHDFLTAIVFAHGVTSATAVRSLLPHLSPGASRAALRYAWQAGAALYATFGTTPAPAGEIAPPAEPREALVDLAVANGDEHAIKFTEACLREYDANPQAVYLAAARHAVGVLVTS